MTVIAMNRNNFAVVQYNNVSNIAYNSVTNTYVVTYAGGSTANIIGDNYVVSVLFS